MFDFIYQAANKLNFDGYKIPVVRTLLALSTLGTLLSSNIVDLMNPLNIQAVTSERPLYLQISLFSLLESHLILAKVIAIAILLFSISGFLPRWSGPLHWWVSFSFAVSCLVVDGGDQINSLLCLYLIPILFCDRRKNQWLEKDYNIQNQYLKIFLLSIFWIARLQVSMVYFQAATAKLSVSEWTNGTAVYYWFSHPIHGMPEWLIPLMMPVLASAIGVALLTWGTLIFEGILAMSLFMEGSMRKHLFVPALLFHAGIVLVHGLSSFFLVMSAALAILLIPCTQNIKNTTNEVKYA